MNDNDKTKIQLISEVQELRQSVSEIKGLKADCEQTERALKESGERYQAFIQQSSEGIYRLELDNPMDISLPHEEQINHIYDNAYIAECNNIFMEMYNVVSVDEIINSRLVDLHGSNNDLINRAEIHRFVTSNYRVENEEISKITPNGERVWFFNSIIGVVEDNKLVRMWGTQANITERKHSEELIQRSHSLLSSVIESPDNVIIFALDRNYNYLSFNMAHVKEMKKVYGADIEIGHYILAYIPREDDRLKAEKNYKRVLNGERFVCIDEYGKSDSRFWYELIFNPIHDNLNHVTGFTVFVADITDRKRAELARSKSEEALVSVFQHAVDPIYKFNLITSKYEYFSPSCINTHGYTPEEMIAGGIEKEASRIYPDDLVHLQKHIDDLISGNVSHNIQKVIEYRFKHKTRGYRWLSDSRSILSDASGTPIAIYGGIRDVTEQHNMREELFKVKKLESVGLLAGGIAHDFNNILTGLFGNIELAKLVLPQDHKAYSYIETANQALGRATNLTKQLLTFAKGGDPILEVVNIGLVIQDSIELSLSGSNVRTVFDLPDNLWQIKADKGQLSQIITNLIINAKQAMPDGGSLHIDAQNIKDVKENRVSHLSGNFVQFRIRDEGLGIAPKHIEKIFDPYFTTKQTGSGLGLATVHRIVAKHNGHISVDSKLGSGTIFTIYLPAEKSSYKPTDIVSTNVIEESKSKSGHILVMDDDAMVRDLSIAIIESIGYTANNAVDGEDTIEKYISADKNGNPFDIVIMDLTIPGGLGGKESVKKILTINPKAKVIVSSGYSTDPIMANYSDYGFKGRLVKPYQINDLKKELVRVMELE